MIYTTTMRIPLKLVFLIGTRTSLTLLPRLSAT
jgi:hypothetical protein